MGITNLHRDIIQTHILTRLDGRSLTAAGCTSSHLQSICSDNKPWSDICSSIWPSTKHPLTTQTILNFTSGHRSFFSDAFPSPSHRLITVDPDSKFRGNEIHKLLKKIDFFHFFPLRGASSGVAVHPPQTATSSPPTTKLISSVDFKYDGRLMFSKVVSTDTTPSHCFSSYRFRVDLIEPKELVQSEIKLSNDDREIELDLENHMELSWIVIDPSMNRAVNLSSVKPVSVKRNWFTDEYELTFAVVTAVDDDGEYVSWNIEMTCGVKDENLELYVSGVSLTVQDIDGRYLNGKDSMVILKGLMVAERRRCNDGEWRKEKYDEYIERRKERKELTERKERRLDLVRVCCGMAFLGVYWSFALY